MVRSVWENRKHYFTAAAQAMRHILIEKRLKTSTHEVSLETVNFRCSERRMSRKARRLPPLTKSEATQI